MWTERSSSSSRWVSLWINRGPVYKSYFDVFTWAAACGQACDLVLLDFVRALAYCSDAVTGDRSLLGIKGGFHWLDFYILLHVHLSIGTCAIAATYKICLQTALNVNLGTMSREIKESALNDASHNNEIAARDDSFAEIVTAVGNMEGNFQQLKTAVNNYRVAQLNWGMEPNIYHFRARPASRPKFSPAYLGVMRKLP